MEDEQFTILPLTWFARKITLEQIRWHFSRGKKEIRIASGFFTIKGWGLIRRYTLNKQVYLLVGIDEPGEERARIALVKEIMRQLATGLDVQRRQSVEDLVVRMQSGSLSIVDARATSHHAKLYIVDRNTAIVASANTTGRGFLDQIESGGLYAPRLVDSFIENNSNRQDICNSNTVEGLHRFIESLVEGYVEKFDEYFNNAINITEELLEALQHWLKFVSPWDIYLKTLLALEQTPEPETRYNKTPVSYQKEAIAQTLRQIRARGGSMLVASTGLGKTVMGMRVAIQLRAENIIDKAIVICPVPVSKTWKKEMRSAGIHADYFNLSILDKKDVKRARELENWEELIEELKYEKSRYLLILDESHQLRKRYPDEFGNRKKVQVRKELISLFLLKKR